MANVTGSFTATGNGAACGLFQDFNVDIGVPSAFVGTIVFERSFDGSTWNGVTYSDGTALSFTAAASFIWREPQAGVQYRLRCSAFTSGTATWRLSQ